MPLPMPPSRSGEGFRLLDLGLFADATKAFQAGLKADPNDLKCRLGLGRAQMEMGAREEALKTFEEVLQLKPEHLEARSHRALMHALTGDEPAARQLEMVASDRRAAFHEHFNFGMYLASKGDRRAQAEFEYALRVEQKSSKVLLELGKLAQAAGENLQALRMFQRSCEHAGGAEYQPFVTMARAHRAVGENKAAAIAMVEALKRAPKVKELYAESFTYCMDCRDYDNAFKAAVGLRQFDPDNPKYLVWQSLSQGLASLNQEKIVEARTALESAVRMDPDSLEVKAALAQVLAASKEEARALTLFNEVLAQKPDPQVAAELGWLMVRMLKPKAAKPADGATLINAIQRSFDVAPNDPRLNFFMAVGFSLQERNAEALPFAEKGVATQNLLHLEEAKLLLEKVKVKIRRAQRLQKK